MKHLFIPALLLVLLAMAPSKKTKVIFFGDSITQMGAEKGGYIDRMNIALKARKQSGNYELIGAGIGGNKVDDLDSRITDDVINKNPDVVLIWVGVNDVWHKGFGSGTDIDKFENYYVSIIKKLQERNIKVIVATPAVIGEKKDGSNQFDTDLDAYSEVIRRLAKEKSCKLVDIRKIFIAYENNHNVENKEAGLLTTDKVHLTDLGNQLVADEMLKAIVQ